MLYLINPLDNRNTIYLIVAKTSYKLNFEYFLIEMTKNNNSIKKLWKYIVLQEDCIQFVRRIMMQILEKK